MSGTLKLVMSSAAILIVLGMASESFAQNGFARPVGIQVQLPVVSVFNVRTAVSVPDGGTMSLGGISRHSEGRISRGFGPLRNTASGFSTGGRRATVSASIISNREIDATLTAEGNRLAISRDRIDPNGSRAVQARANFLTRHIGRSSRR